MNSSFNCDKDFNYNGFKLILQSTQSNLIEYFTKSLPEMYGKDKCIITNDFIFAKGNLPVVILAHMDTVHQELPRDLFFDRENKVIWSPQGCGGDDRCGVFGALFIAKNMGENKPSILFTTNEEIGCVGARSASKNKELKNAVSDIKYAVEIDRRGSKDAVFYDCKNSEFQKYVEKFGFVKATGSNSDINVICNEDSWNMGCVNVSSGYYNEHTKHEFIRVNELFDTINKVINMISDFKNVDKFKFNDDEQSDAECVEDDAIDSHEYVGGYDSFGSIFYDPDIDQMIAEQAGCDITDPFCCSEQV